jgi:hypothetical protein
MPRPDLGNNSNGFINKGVFQAGFGLFFKVACFFAFWMEIHKPMYTLQDFRVMPFEKKCDLITFRGSYLTQRMLGDCKVFLYYASEFYIEVFYSPKHQKVLMINAFDKAIGLDPYLEAISLDDLTF